MAFSSPYAYIVHFWRFMNYLDQKNEFLCIKIAYCIFIFLEIDEYMARLHPRTIGYWPGITFGEDETKVAPDLDPRRV